MKHKFGHCVEIGMAFKRLRQLQPRTPPHPVAVVPMVVVLSNGPGELSMKISESGRFTTRGAVCSFRGLKAIIENRAVHRQALWPH